MILIEDASAFNELNPYHFEKTTKDPGTLVVVLKMNIMQDRKGYKERLETPLVSFSITQYRPGQKLPPAIGSRRPVAFPLSWSNETLERALTGLITGYIY